MSLADVKIVPAQPSWLKAVAHIHYESLPDDFLPSLGLDFLEQVYYPAAIQSSSAITLVALVAGIPSGFITIAHDSRSFTKDVLQGQYPTLAWYAGRAILRDVRQLLKCLELFWAAVITKPDPIQGEIVFIAVQETQRGQGIGKKLVEAALNYLQQKQVAVCRTKTLARNTDVIKMYERMGWRIREHFRLLGREYVTLVSGMLLPEVNMPLKAER